MDLKKKLQDLPADAIIAFAVKCIRRAQSAHQIPAGALNRQELIKTLDLAIDIAKLYSSKSFYNYQERQAFSRTAEKAGSALAEHPWEVAQLASKLSEAVVNILHVKVAEDPNTEWIWEKAIENHTWDTAQDILADKTKKSRPAREADAEKRRVEIALEAAQNIFLMVSSQVNKDILISDLESIASHYVLKSSTQK